MKTDSAETTTSRRQKYHSAYKKAEANTRQKKIDAGELVPKDHCKCAGCGAIKPTLEAKMVGWVKLHVAHKKKQYLCNECNT